MFKIRDNNYLHVTSTENNHDRLVDDKTLEQLAEDITEEMMPELLDLFILETDKRLKRLVIAVQRVDLDQTALESHALKSSVATFGATHLETKFSQLETECQQGNIKNVLALMPQIEEIFKQTMIVINNSSFKTKLYFNHGQ
jgi:HPt (histidine-containing phosphotransfer) domain-containing protein